MLDSLPPAVCVLDLKKKEWVRRGKVPCVMKKINFPFFNPSYSALFALKCLHSLHIDVHSTVNSACCTALVLQSLITLASQGKPNRLLSQWCTHTVLSLVLLDLCGESGRGQWMAFIQVGVSFWSLANPTIIEGITVLTMQLIVYQAVVPWILAEVVWLS